MEKKTLLVTAKDGSLKFQETAWPYNENAHDEQVETCVESIRQQIADADKLEMMDSFQMTIELIEWSLTSVSQDGVMLAPPWDDFK